MNQKKLKKKKRMEFSNEEYLLFLIGKNYYAFTLKKVREIIKFKIPIPMHNMPKYCKGFIVHRKQTIIIFDLREKFKESIDEHSEKTSIILLEPSIGIYIGTIVDQVDKVERLKHTGDEEYEKAINTKTRLTKKIICLNGLIIQILDLKKLLSEKL